MGVTYFKRFRMEIRLQPHLFSDTFIVPGYRFIPWHDDLIPHHAEAKHHSFRDEIDAQVFPCFNEAPDCFRLMEDISVKRGFVPKATWLAAYAARPGAELEYCGTVQGIADDTTVGGIQNLGVTPPHRGQGLGRALLLKALQGFWNAKLSYATLEVTAQNVQAVALYRSLGFRRVKTVYKAVEVAYS